MNAEQMETLWTVKQVAEFLQVSTTWVYNQVEAGTIPHARLGTGRGVLRFHPSRIREYAAKQDGAGAKALTGQVIPLRRGT